MTTFFSSLPLPSSPNENSLLLFEQSSLSLGFTLANVSVFGYWTRHFGTLLGHVFINSNYWHGGTILGNLQPPGLGTISLLSFVVRKNPLLRYAHIFIFITLIMTHLEFLWILHWIPSHIDVHCMCSATFACFCLTCVLLPHTHVSFATHVLLLHACSLATLACSFAADVFCMTYSRFFGYTRVLSAALMFFLLHSGFSDVFLVLSATLMFFLLQSHFSDFLASMQFANQCYLPFGFCRKT